MLIAVVINNHLYYDYVYTRCMYSNQTIVTEANQPITMHVQGGKYEEFYMWIGRIVSEKSKPTTCCKRVFFTNSKKYKNVKIANFVLAAP